MANSYPLSYVSTHMREIVSGMLQQYGEQAEEKVNKVTKEVAEDFAKELAQVTPRSASVDQESPHIADTVQVTSRSNKQYGKKITTRFVHFGKWQISHLLEFGWTLRNGKSLTRSPFVRPLFDRKKDEYVQKYKEELSR